VRNPEFEWRSPATDGGTIEISDGTATWQFILDAPFAPRGFELIAPATPTVRSGDTVTLQMTPPLGELSNVIVSAYASDLTAIFKFDETTGLVRTGTGITFTVPATPPGDITIDVQGDVVIPIHRCDHRALIRTKTIRESMPVLRKSMREGHRRRGAICRALETPARRAAARPVGARSRHCIVRLVATSSISGFRFAAHDVVGHARLQGHGRWLIAAHSGGVERECRLGPVAVLKEVQLIVLIIDQLDGVIVAANDSG
jgi:hypothetical protein